jgi:hypothetical protein
MKAPITPYDKKRSSSRVARAGIIVWYGRFPPWKENQFMVSFKGSTVTLRAFGWPSSSENAAPRACRVKPHPFGTAAGVFDLATTVDHPAPYLQCRNLTSTVSNPRLCARDDKFRHTGISTLDIAARIPPLIRNCGEYESIQGE